VNSCIYKATVFAGFTIGRDHGTPSGAGTDLNNPNNLINFASEQNYDQTYQLRAGFHLPDPGYRAWIDAGKSIDPGGGPGIPISVAEPARSALLAGVQDP
jgi:hypothetical protein